MPPGSSLPKPEYMARAANRLRQQMRSKDPTDPDFQLDQDHVPCDFEPCEVVVYGCHVQAVSSPFHPTVDHQHFVRADDHTKQVPLIFVLMSARKKGDYREVLEKLLEILPSAAAVQQIMLDFEKAVLSAI